MSAHARHVKRQLLEQLQRCAAERARLCGATSRRLEREREVARSLIGKYRAATVLEGEQSDD